MTDTPNIGLPLVPQGTLDPAAGLNLALNKADALIQTRVISMSLLGPPTSSSDGDLYIVAGEGGTATGPWANQELNLARYVFEGDFYQFLVAGEAVNFVLNDDDGNFYKFVPGSPSSWVLAAGLGDAPNDGEPYFRQSESWVPFVPPALLTVQDLDNSPPQVVSDVEVMIFGEGLRFSEVEPGVVLVEVDNPAEVIEESGTARNALIGDRNSYVRFTNVAAKTYTFNDALGYPKHAEFHGRNHGAGDLTIVATSGMTINAPAGGSLVIPQGGTFTLKIVSDEGDEADLFGMTDAP